MEGGQRKVPNTQDILHILGINISNSCAFPPLIWSGGGIPPHPPDTNNVLVSSIGLVPPPAPPQKNNNALTILINVVKMKISRITYFSF